MIQLKDIKKTYKLGKVKLEVLKRISLKIAKGEFVAIMGSSGSGKTTLLNILGCLDKSDSGTYTLEGISINQLRDNKLTRIRNQKIGFIFQNYNLLARTSAIKNVELPMIYGNFTNRNKRAQEAISIVGLEGRIYHKPNELSGGEQQRIAIARALINNPSIILADEPTGNLDTRTGKEIMGILQDLNRKGVTVVMVTHDSNIARYASRIIHITDGQILNDQQIKSFTEDVSSSPDLPSAANQKEGRLRSFLGSPLLTGRKFNLFKIGENIRMGISCLLSNKMRTSLTMLGLVIGVASVISMIAIGHGAYRRALEIISDFGPNVIFLRKERNSKIEFFMSDVKDIIEKCPSVEIAIPGRTELGDGITTSYKGKHHTAFVAGTLPEWPYVRNSPIVKGEMFTDDDVLNANKVAVIGHTVIEKLFGDRDPLGEFITVRNVKVKVIGIYQKKEKFGMRDRNNAILLPLRTAQKRIFGSKKVDFISVLAVSTEKIKNAVEEVESVIRERHNIVSEESKKSFRVMSQDMYITMAEKSTQTFTNLLAIIAAISLIVGCIGIMNIMLVSVTERTREIGIRKALGAKRGDILGQIISETLIMCFAGGVIGVLAGVISAHAINESTKWVTVITLDSIILSFIFACIVGLLSAFYPSLKAAMLNPVEALRYE